MVAEGSVEDALERARRLPALGVGLHLSLTHGHSVLGRERLPHLVDVRGRFEERLVRAALRWLAPAARRELRAEIEAQFAAFLRTGLALDHVSVHQHMHLHPVVLEDVLAVGRACGMPYLRVPLEPPALALGGPRQDAVTRALARRMAHLCDARGIAHADALCGLGRSGGMDEDNLRLALQRLPEGLTELYLHPAAAPSPLLEREQPGCQGERELAGLLSPAVRQLAEDGGIALRRCSPETLAARP